MKRVGDGVTTLTVSQFEGILGGLMAFSWKK